MRLATLCLFASTAFAQVPIEKQPDLEAFRAAVKEARAKRPLDAKALVKLKQGPIDPTLAEDLSKYDWYQAGAWSYPEKKFSPSYDDAELFQFDLRRYLPDGAELSYSLSINQRDPTKLQLNHLNFTLPPTTTAAFKKVGRQTYLEVTAYGEKELHRVVSYEKGILIIDLSYDGVPNSKLVKFRDVRIAMPRLFESSGK
ncbi:MAG: hypothetical protein Q8L48_30920 [Archangium sp.]|nr:hypothetical protein [Archangium sp.]